MSVYETTIRPLPQGSVATFRLVSLVETAIDRFVTWRNARSTARELNALSDSQLTDIGLSRYEITEFAENLAGR